MIWNMTLDLYMNYKNYFAITFDCHTLVLVIISIFLMGSIQKLQKFLELKIS